MNSDPFTELFDQVRLPESRASRTIDSSNLEARIDCWCQDCARRRILEDAESCPPTKAICRLLFYGNRPGKCNAQL